MHYTAQVRNSDGMVCAVTETTDVLVPPEGMTFIPIESYRTDLVLKKYENGQFVDHDWT
jgi:hypothetical protein